MPLSARHCAVLLTLAPVFAAAALPAQEAPPPPFRTQLDIGFTSTTGNSEITTFALGAKVEHRPGRWLFTQTLNWIIGYDSGVERANNIRAAVRADYAMSPHLKAYGYLAFDRDPFAGVDRRFEESVGLGWSVLTGPRNLLDFEAGAGVNQQRSGTTESFPVGRVAARWRHNFTGNAYFEHKLEALENLDDTEDLRVTQESVLVAPLSTRIALRLGWLVKFDNQPATGKQDTDSLFSSGIQIVF